MYAPKLIAIHLSQCAVWLTGIAVPKGHAASVAKICRIAVASVSPPHNCVLSQTGRRLIPVVKKATVT